LRCKQKPKASFEIERTPDRTIFQKSVRINTSYSGGGQYLTITSCVGNGNWGRTCKKITNGRKVKNIL
jgi:hypothetical protein